MTDPYQPDDPQGDVWSAQSRQTGHAGRSLRTICSRDLHLVQRSFSVLAEQSAYDLETEPATVADAGPEASAALAPAGSEIVVEHAGLMPAAGLEPAAGPAAEPAGPRLAAGPELATVHAGPMPVVGPEPAAVPAGPEPEAGPVEPTLAAVHLGEPVTDVELAASDAAC